MLQNEKKKIDWIKKGKDIKRQNTPPPRDILPYKKPNHPSPPNVIKLYMYFIKRYPKFYLISNQLYKYVIHNCFFKSNTILLIIKKIIIKKIEFLSMKA